MTANAQDKRRSAVNIGLVYPISTNGIRATECSNSFSLNAIAGVSRTETGLSIAGFSNIILDDASGCHLAGFANLTRNGSSGVQVAGFMNRSGDANMQVAGFINIARKVKGVQLAGFINIADSSDYPIGIINIIRNGEKSIGFSIDETRTALLTLRSGGRELYGILGLGYNNRMNTIQSAPTGTCPIKYRLKKLPGAVFRRRPRCSIGRFVESYLDWPGVDFSSNSLIFIELFDKKNNKF